MESYDIPAYRPLLQSGELAKRAQLALERQAACDGCAWHCGANRRRGELGHCATGIQARISSYGPHHGEERPLSGWRGSGTIFFNRCNLACQFCQNFNISQSDAGEEVDAGHLAAIMIELQEAGCHNINLVSPSHVVAQILAALVLAAGAGLHLPLVYNSGGYDSPETLALLDGVVDIYMPDMKYASEQVARILSGIPNYPQANRASVREMHRQVGDLQIEGGLACRGLLVRHLVLPNRLAGTPEIVQFLAEEVSKNTYLNLMDQYRPVYRAHRFPELNRRITQEEYQEAITYALRAGLYRLDRP